MTVETDKPFVVGVAGGIGAGKSTVLEVFSDELAIPTVKADDLARETVAPGGVAHEEIADNWPMSIDDDGEVNRTWLRQNVLIDPEQKSELENITHTKIDNLKKQRLEKVAQAGGKLAVYEALFFELGLESSVDRLLVVDITEERQLQQASSRDGSNSRVREIMNLQVSRDERLQRASKLGADIIFNGGSEAELRSMARIYGVFYQRVAELVHRNRQTERTFAEYAQR